MQNDHKEIKKNKKLKGKMTVNRYKMTTKMKRDKTQR